MNCKFTRALWTFMFLMLIQASAMAQNGWATCGSNSGLLDGSITPLTTMDTIPVANLITTPGPVATIPQTEYLIILRDSMASDTLGDAIIATSLDGSIPIADLNLAVGDTVTVVPFSYDIQQIKLAVQGLLFNSVIFLGSCCNVLDSQAPVPGICDSLNAGGIMDSSDVNNINDLITFLSVFAGGGSTSLRGLNSVLVQINAQIGTLAQIGCTNGVNEICYASDSLFINQAHYIVSPMTSVAAIGGATQLELGVYPNPFNEQLTVSIQSELGGEHRLLMLDATGRVVHQSVQQVTVGMQNITLAVQDLPAGIYYLQVQNDDQMVTQKVIKY